MSLVNEQIDRVREIDRGALLANFKKGTISGRTDRIPLVLTYHPAINSLVKPSGISTLRFLTRRSIGQFFLSLRSLHFDAARTLKIYWLGLGLWIRITVIKGAALVVKSPDVKCVYQ